MPILPSPSPLFLSRKIPARQEIPENRKFHYGGLRLPPAGGVPRAVSEILEVVVVLDPQLVRVPLCVGVLLGVHVEALGVAGEPDGRDDGPPLAPAVDLVPVHAAEEGVVLDPLRAPAHVA